jgi:hypothetical protein
MTVKDNVVAVGKDSLDLAASIWMTRPDPGKKTSSGPPSRRRLAGDHGGFLQIASAAKIRDPPQRLSRRVRAA